MLCRFSVKDPFMAAFTKIKLCCLHDRLLSYKLKINILVYHYQNGIRWNRAGVFQTPLF